MTAVLSLRCSARDLADAIGAFTTRTQVHRRSRQTPYRRKASVIPSARSLRISFQFHVQPFVVARRFHRLTPAGETREAGREETESRLTTHAPERPAGTTRLMEEICDRENLKEACRLVSSFLTEMVQQIHSLRASGVMSSQAASTFASDASAFRRSAGRLCTTPPEI